MILNIRHKGLKRFYETGDTRGIQAKWQRKLRSVLIVLETSEVLEDFDVPGLGFHPLKGDLAGYYAVSVTGNWRLIFQFEDGHVIDLDLVDYH